METNEEARPCNRLACSNLIERKPREALSAFRARLYCSRDCAHRCSPYKQQHQREATRNGQPAVA